MSDITKKLIAIQKELKAPKGQRNTYGNYNYRSCEDILEAVKPLLAKNECSLMLTDEIVQIGERYYIKATARLIDAKSDAIVENTAYAREEETKKGMDGSQITGTASSYARKYCLNGLFLIDDTKDADTDEYRKTSETKAETNKPAENAETTKKAATKMATAKQIELMMKICEENDLEFSEKVAKEMTLEQASKFISRYKGGN